MKKIIVFMLLTAMLLSGIPKTNANCSISIYQYAIDPPTASAYACYSMLFINSCVIPKGEYITFTFPAGSVLTSGFACEFSFAGRPDRYTVNGNLLEIQLTEDLPLGRHMLRICRVKNPPKSGPHVIIVNTKDSSYITPEFHFYQTQISAPTVTVTPDYVEACAEYLIKFRVSTPTAPGCACHRLTTITVVFPANLGIKGIDFGGVSVNGQAIPSGNLRAYSNMLEIIIDYEMRAGDTLEVRISSKNGIKNPSVPGWYTLTMYTSLDTLPVKSSPYYIRPSSVSRAHVLLGSPHACSYSSFHIKFQTGPNGRIKKGGYVRLAFPKGFEVPEKVDRKNITVNGKPVLSSVGFGIESIIEGLYISIYVPEEIPEDSTVDIVVLPESGIRLPSFSGGDFNIFVQTSTEPVTVPSFEFSIDESRISQMFFDVSPRFVTLPSSVVVSFKLGGCHSLVPGMDTISMLFNTGFRLPKNILKADIKVNGDLIANIPFVEGNIITISPPKEIPGGSVVKIEFAESFGIKNPDKANIAYKVECWTSRERSRVSSPPIVFATTTLSNISLELEKPLINRTTKAFISFTTGKAGAIRNGAVVNVKFPEGFKFIGSMSPRNFVFGDISSRKAIWSNNTLTLISPKDYEPSSIITIEIDSDAGLSNPTEPGRYNIQVWTDPEPDPVESMDFAVVEIPKVVFRLTPTSPDGKNGFYKTKPKLEIIGQNSLDENAKIHLEIGGMPSDYKGPLILSDGEHFIMAKAEDKFGNISEYHSLSVLVDSTPPQFDNPQGKVFTRSPKFKENVVVFDENLDSVEGSASDNIIYQKSFGNSYWIDYASAVENCYNFELSATDKAGNVAVWKREMCFDWSPPPLELPPMIKTDKPEIEIKGKTEGKDFETSLVCNGKAVEIAEDGSFTVKFALKNGYQAFSFTAKDKAGNTNVKSVTVIAELFKTIIVTLGSQKAYVNGKETTLAVAPYSVSGVTMLPFRFLGESLGAKVEYNAEKKQITMNLHGKTIELVIGNPTALVDGLPVALKHAPEVKKGVTFVPLRFVAESLGATVSTDKTGKKITISYIIKTDALGNIYSGSFSLPVFVCPVRSVF
jgi:hypothetical protein